VLLLENKSVLSGNQAIARGFYEAGGLVSASYPGSPTVEIIHTLNTDYDGIYSEFSVNEKVALEVGIGASFAGARTMVAMKHVGLNIAADPFMTFTQTKINGGFLLVTGDDPGMSSSQNEQDNRFFGKFANAPVFDPSNSQEAKDFVKVALEISEKFTAPAIMRITSRLCHSRSAVETAERVEKEVSGFSKVIEDYGMIPPNTYEKQYVMKNRIEQLSILANSLDINIYEESSNKEILFVTSGIVYENLKELGLNVSIYKLGMVYPLPILRLKELSINYKKIIVIEEMMPFIEEELKIHGIQCQGKAYFNFTGELNTDDIEKGLVKANILPSLNLKHGQAEETIPRLPMFCSGCPHRPVFDILKKAKASVIGDIGCYSLAVLEPLRAVNSIISMGASIGIMKGMSKALRLGNKEEPLVAVIGDGTFFHSGMTGLMNLLHNLDEDYNMTLLILNNGTTAMTGGQMNAGSGGYKTGYDMDVDIPALAETMGFKNIAVVDQFKYKEAKKTIDDALKHQGLSIIVTTRPCALNFKIVEPFYYVDPKICIGCRSCVKTNCPPIIMKSYEAIEKLKSSIKSDMCVGCSVCAQVCPVNAIKCSADNTEEKEGTHRE